MTAIVYTASANMPQCCKGHYRKVYVIDVAPEHAMIAVKKQPPTYEVIGGQQYASNHGKGWRPTSIQAKTVLKVLRSWGPQSVGSTDRCAYRRAVAEAEEFARQYNEQA